MLHNSGSSLKEFLEDSVNILRRWLVMGQALPSKT